MHLQLNSLEHNSKNASLIAPVLIAHAAGALGYGLILPYLPYVAADRGADPWATGLLVGIHPALAAVFAPIFGSLTRRFRTEWLMAISICGSAVSFMLLATSHTLFDLFVARALDGLSGGNIVLANLLISERTAKQNLIRAYTWLAGAYALGYIIGPLLGMLLARAAPRYAFLVAACVMSATATLMIWTGFSRRDTRSSSGLSMGKSQTGRLQPHAGRMLVMLHYSLLTCGLSLVISCFGMLAKAQLNAPVWAAGIPAAVFGVSSLLAALLATRLHHAHGRYRRLQIGDIIVALSLALFSTALTITDAALYAVPLALGASFARPVAIALLAENFGEESHGAVFGLAYAIDCAAQIAAPLFGGALIVMVGAPAVSLIAAAVSLPAVFIVRIVRDSSI